MLTRQQLEQMLVIAAEALKAQSTYFCKLDSVAGDGDHGLTIARMADAVKAEVARGTHHDIKELLDAVGMVCMTINGGSAGPLWGTIFTGFAEGVPAEKNELTEAELKAMLLKGKTEFMDISDAKVGDKTMVDALYPAIDAAVAAKGSLKTIMDAAAKAAAAGAEATKNYVAKFGRAKNLGEKSRGSLDPGATSLSVLFAGLAAACKD